MSAPPCSCQVYGKSGVPNARGRCLVCGGLVDPAGPVAGNDPEDGPSLTPDQFTLDAVGHGCFARDLDGVIRAFVPSIRDRLIERGVLTQRADTRWYLSWRGFDLAREQAADMSCCDFCSARPVAWLAPCASFAMPIRPGLPKGMSQGDWAACDPCGQLIADGSPLAKASLLIRAQLAAATQLPRQAAAIPGLARTLRELKEELHVRFWQHYKGGALAIPTHPFGH